MWPGLLVAVVSVATALVPAQGPPAADICSRFGTPQVAGSVANGELTEISGRAASRRHPGVLWTHNDSGGRPEVSALGSDGADLGTYPVEGAAATDWEDIAVGPGAGGSGSAIYVGDIGDNGDNREVVTLYRVAEPDARPDGTDHPLAGAETIRLRYPGGPQNAEALSVDPASGDLFIVTKRAGAARILRAPAASLVDGATVDMIDEGPLRLDTDPGDGVGDGSGVLVTGADISPDGSVVLVRTYQSVLAYTRRRGQDIVATLGNQACAGPRVEEPQGEAVAFTAAGDAYFTASEGMGVPLHRVDIQGPALSAKMPPGPDTDSGGVTSSSDNGALFLVLGAAALLAVACVAVWLLARRRDRRDGAGA